MAAATPSVESKNDSQSSAPPSQAGRLGTRSISVTQPHSPTSELMAELKKKWAAERKNSASPLGARVDRARSAPPSQNLSWDDIYESIAADFGAICLYAKKNPAHIEMGSILNQIKAADHLLTSGAAFDRVSALKLSLNDNSLKRIFPNLDRSEGLKALQEKVAQIRKLALASQ